MSATPASMLQVVSSGLQDRERLNAPCGLPSIKFYKSVLRQRTRWASQWRRVEFDNLADFGRTAIATLPINGELITRATLVIDLPDIYTPQLTAINQQLAVSGNKKVAGPYWAWTNSVGHAICATVDFMIDGQVIDSFDSQHLEVLDEQRRSVEHFDSTDALIARDPSTFSDQQTIQAYNQEATVQPQTNPQSVEIIVPFWWNRGPGPQALPIQALWKDKVQIRVSFRPVQQCVYTSCRINPLNPPLSANQGAGPLPNIAGCGFFIRDASSSTLIYDAGSTENMVAQGLPPGPTPFPGSVLPTPTMPTEYHFTDAYWIVEYVSLEDREATAFRLADLEIPIEQHVPIPPIITGGSPRVRIRMDQGGLVRDLTWVAQRVEAPTYNAHFLFSRDLGPTGFAEPASPCDIPWWPNAEIPNWDYGTGYLKPGFSDRNSEPVIIASMSIRGLKRFENEAPSFFRSLMPALNCKRTPLINRYIYRYDFDYWPTGGLAEALYKSEDEIRGCANWDKLPKRELALTMNQSSCGGFTWAPDTSQAIQTISDISAFVNIDNLFSPLTDGLKVTLTGARPYLPDGSVDVLGNNGEGAIVEGYIDMTALRRQPGYIHLYARTNAQGSAALVQKKTAGYEWIAVAGSGGYGLINAGGGGAAGSAVEVGWQGGNGSQTHESVTTVGGSVVYNNISLATNIPVLGTSFMGPNPGFQTITPGTFNSVELYFSITNNTQTAAYIQILYNNITQGTTYVLTSPTSTVFVPLSKYKATYNPTLQPIQPAPDTLVINTDDIINFEISVINVPGQSTEPPNPFLCNTTDGINAAAKLYVEQNAGSLVIPRTFYGGGGGGRLDDEGVGLTDGQKMSTNPVFVMSHLQTGGRTFVFHGGDGYYGGGSGSLCGGGGGSYVSELITQVNTYKNQVASPVSIRLEPQRRVPTIQPSYNIYSWVTRYNRLRINSGRGALMFSETT